MVLTESRIRKNRWSRQCSEVRVVRKIRTCVENRDSEKIMKAESQKRGEWLPKAVRMVKL